MFELLIFLIRIQIDNQTISNNFIEKNKQVSVNMSKEPWNTLHLKKGDAKPVVDPDTVTIFAMRFD